MNIEDIEICQSSFSDTWYIVQPDKRNKNPKTIIGTTQKEELMIRLSAKSPIGGSAKRS